MKTRLFKVLNFFALNVLFFTLFLNFIHKAGNATPAIQPVPTNTSIKATVLIERPEQYLQKSTARQKSAKSSSEEVNNLEALKLSFN